MPFQALPIAFRKVTGNPLAKSLLIFLTWKCDLQNDPFSAQSGLFEFDWQDAADFCECGKDEVYAALAHLERLRLVYPDDQWTYVFERGETDGRSTRWDFLRIALPISGEAPEHRNRFKASSDQFDAMWRRDGYACVTCGTNHDDVESWHVDHIIPRSRGGADVEDNCQAICGKCNSRKGARVHFLDFLGARK